MGIRSLGVKLSLQVTLVIVLVMGTVGWLSIYQQGRRLTTILETRAEWMLGQLALTLEYPIWNLDDDQIDNLLLSYLTDPDVLSIRIAEPDTALIMRHVRRDPESLMPVPVDDEQPEPTEAGAFARTAPVVHEGEVLGHVRLTFSRRFVTTQLEETMLFVGVVLAALVVVVTPILLLLVRLLVSRPLADKVRAATQIAAGEVDIQLAEVKSQDEIGSLNAAFHSMVAYLRQMAGLAQQISEGNLRQEYQPGSAEDVLGAAFLQMTHYLREMAEVATEIAGGDLRRQVEPRSADDELGLAFERMSSLRLMVRQVQEGADQLETASTALKQMSEGMTGDARGAAEKAHDVSATGRELGQYVGDMANRMTESAASISGVTQNTRQVADIAAEATQIATSTAQVIAALAERSEEIGALVDLISDVTRQTHLLALNATIEAERSGDAGGRFAVVAAEVKELARTTAQSAEDIARRVQAIQQSSGESMAAIGQLTGIVDQVGELTTTIAAAVEQQDATQRYMSESMTSIAASSEGIVGAMAETAGVSDDILQRANAVQRAAGELSALSERLNDASEQFRV